MDRRTFIAFSGWFLLGIPALLSETHARAFLQKRDLLTAPIEIGDWAGSAPHDADAVIARMREACLSGVRLVSDRQPKRLRVDDHSSGAPHIWLHEENPDMAWIVVHIVSRHWDQLAYQFGHELGHVLCNSWLPQAKLKPPNRWLEESMVEAFSIRGLGLLADSWERHPPFPHDAAYAEALRKYRKNLIVKYRRGGEVPISDLAAWFRANRPALERAHGLNRSEGPAIVAIADELERDPRCVADIGAVNRWPALSAVPIEKYLDLWQRSCSDLKIAGVLPARLRGLLGVA